MRGPGASLKQVNSKPATSRVTLRITLCATGLLAACHSGPRRVAEPGQVVTPRGVLVASLAAAPYDRERHAETCKVFHHAFDPAGRLLTKGLGGTYDHHRGLFLGWNQLNWRGRSFDFWHCRNGETQRFHAAIDPAELGLSGDWQVVEVHWCTGADELVLQELRALRARDLGRGVVALDVAVALHAVSTPVRLAGDPQHSGQQFRALQEFAPAGAAKVRYLRPAGAAASRDDIWTGCDWIAAILPLADGEVTVLRVEGSGNPQPTTWSTRDYGRFGATFATEVTPNLPLQLQWTYVIASGARDAAFCAAQAAAAQSIAVPRISFSSRPAAVPATRPAGAS
jgi:hypothetical protein